ncbi:MAG: STAS domain-containing protein [Acidobacteria bacterium]|nr:STAS domain-containing protein [Acidobacteriota bacterium]MBK8147104.1 STAS domain-containing protein [Acidobacteriota bacterium]MBK8812339.1 STAS domain-containing protein [Acidobacteriota bacterium]
MLEIQERQNGEMTVLDLEGNIIMGGGSARLRDEIKRLIGEDKTDILLNLEKVKYIDSSGAGEILAGVGSLSELGGHLKLTNLMPKVKEVLTLSSILPILEVYDDETSAAAG